MGKSSRLVRGEDRVGIAKFKLDCDVEIPGVVEDGMPGRNDQRKLGTTRGSPRRSRTAKTSRISRHAVKSRCACEWGGWGRLSDDGPGHYNLDPSEDPWGGGVNSSRWCIIASASRHRAGATARERSTSVTTRCTKGECKLDIGRRMLGASLSCRLSGKALPEMPAFQPYRGKTRRTE